MCHGTDEDLLVEDEEVNENYLFGSDDEDDFMKKLASEKEVSPLMQAPSPLSNITNSLDRFCRRPASGCDYQVILPARESWSHKTEQAPNHWQKTVDMKLATYMSTCAFTLVPSTSMRYLDCVTCSQNNMSLVDKPFFKIKDINGNNILHYIIHEKNYSFIDKILELKIDLNVSL